MTNHQHAIYQCRCGKVVRQCRCADRNKPVIVVECDGCKAEPDHNDAIERALERYMNGEAVKHIFKDLAAEKLEEGKAIGRAQAQKFVTSMGQRQAEARLAAVEECGLELSCRARKVDRRTGQRILALARGEGGSDEG